MRPFHWPFEFPEVFLPPHADPTLPKALTHAGFDAFIGNPPFIGGQRIRAAMGGDYLAYIKEAIAQNRPGSADYVAYFFLRAFESLCRGGTLGLIATNTIAQGDTREIGLEKIVKDGGTIYAATSSMPWPGLAAVFVSTVHTLKESFSGQKLLDAHYVQGISPRLDRFLDLGNPKKLAQNSDKSFQGSIPLGAGFVMMPDEAAELIKKDSKNADVLFPYINGQDLNNRPDQSASRWVINFFDWPLEKAEQYSDCMAIIREQVYPQRLKQKRETRKRYWWWYGERAPKLYETIKSLKRVLAVAQTSRTVAFTFIPKGIVYSMMTIIFTFDESWILALLQSSLHDAWVRKYASTMKQDIRYTPSDVFETFPFPQSPIPNLQSLEAIGEEYHEYRRQLMLARQEGLTATYNRFHDPNETAEDIARLRQLHVDMDQAVLAAYGWAGEVTLDHAFRGAGKEARYTLSDGVKEELLRRLLLLNFELAEKEEAEAEKENRKGAKSAKGKKAKAKAKAKGKGKGKNLGDLGVLRGSNQPNQPTLPGMEDDRPKQLGLFGEED